MDLARLNTPPLFYFFFTNIRQHCILGGNSMSPFFLLHSELALLSSQNQTKPTLSIPTSIFEWYIWNIWQTRHFWEYLSLCLLPIGSWPPCVLWLVRTRQVTPTLLSHWLAQDGYRPTVRHVAGWQLLAGRSHHIQKDSSLNLVQHFLHCN